MVKTKPTKHKEDNTFKFQTFSERLNSVNVDIVHRLDLKRNLVPDETDTFFFECLEKWVDLNCTEGYTSFCRQLGRDVQSLGQLLLNQERITSLLIEQIDKENVLFLEPILELVIALSKDLLSDFYPHFSQFFQQLVELLQTKEPQIIEWTFTTLAHLYKNLWRNLVKDIENVYELLLPLLASGKPPHIQQFASESFSFIGRKVSNKASFVELIFTKLLLKPDDCLGVGQLLFHLVKGVKEQFHTSLDVFLPLFLKHVGSVQETVKTNPVFCAVEHCFVLMSRHTTITHCSKVWKLLQQEIASSKKPGILGSLLLLLQWISFKEGGLVNDNVFVTNTLASLLNENLLEEEQETASSACAAMIMSTKSQLSIEQITRLCNLIYHSNWKPKIVLDFTLKVATHAMFESHLMQYYMAFCNSICKLSVEEHSQLLDNLARVIIIKNPLPQSGYDIDSYKTYSLDFSFVLRKMPSIQSVPKLIKSVLEGCVEKMICENLALYVNALICLPNVLPVEAIEATEMLQRIIQEIAGITTSLDAEEPKSKKLKTVRPADFKDKLGLVLSLAVLGARHFSTNLLEHFPWSTMKFVFLNEFTSQNVFYLRSVDFYLTSFYGSYEQDALYSLEVLNQLYEIIGRNICSPYREVRLVTLHILSLFSPTLPTPPENVHSTSVFQICLQAEMVAIGVTEQREKFNFLQSLEAERVVHSIPIGGRFTQVPLQYLLSQFYVNFRPLWDPVMKLIESHAFSMEPTQFWSLYFNFLEQLEEPTVEEPISSTLLEEFEFLNIETDSERLDFSNARSLMWMTMSRFGRITEEQHFVLVPRFLDFWNKEYCVNDASVVQVQDLTSGEQLSIKAPKGNHGNLMKLLIAHLSVLASFKRPKQMCREPEVTSILLRLLSHRSSDVQKKALDCLVAYGFPYLLPYKENLYRLLDEKTFRSEITLFSIDTSSSSILAEHRHGLITILMRLLYGKMMFKAGSGSSSKDNVRHRQEIVLRYIGGFTDAEIDSFLDLSFQLFKGFPQTGNIYDHVVSVMTETNPTQALPPKRIQGALGFMGIIFSKLGNLIKSTQPKLLTILLSICAHVMGLLTKRDQYKAKHLALLKELRSLGLQRLTQFFTKFESYPWSASEIEAVFHVAVWPQLELLSVEGLQGPTPLLRLFQVWSENPRYFVLFGKGHPVRREMWVLPTVLDLLICSKTHSSVCSFIMDIVEKLVSTADYGEEDEEIKEVKEEIVNIVPNFCVELQHHMSADTEVKPNYGSTLLIPYMSPIILHLRKVLSHGLNGRDLNVLMRLSEYVSEPQLSTELARLVITAIKAIVNRRRNNSSLEDKLTRYLNILVNLVNNSVNPQEFLGSLASLFGSVTGSVARQVLCKVLEVICVRESSIKELGDLVVSLNAWDRHRVDQPDFMHRLNTHKKINAILESGTPTFEWTILVLYNCFYFIKMEEDTSLRDSASFSLQQMTKAFERLKYGKRMLNDHFIPQLRLLIQSSNETIRHEAISILSQAVANCGDLNVSLKSLRKLRKVGDVETDFFENSRHLQTHRRSRALLRLGGLLKQEKQILSNETVTQFLLPLATCYLFTETYASQNHLIDAALDCLQAIARSLPWSNYEKLLRFYLSNMTRQIQYQKQAVKAVVAILNGFHFDLKNSQFKSYYVKKAKELQSNRESENISASVVIDSSLDGDELPTSVLPDLDREEETSENEEKPVNFIKEDMATKIHSVIVQSLLPDLNSILTARSKRELQHKSTKQDHSPEDDEILRVPIALALVNLLKNLPSGALERNLPGLLSKVVTFLKSRSNTVRETARDTIIQIIVSLGPEYLSFLMEAASTVLQRGFQVHVYIYTMHSLLVRLVELGQLKSGSLDHIIHPLVELCKKELYGETADEKEVAQIIGKVKEAKGVKAYDTFEIIGKYVSQSHLLNMILPMKEILASTRSFKMTKKVEECLQRGALGLSVNQGLVVDQLLIFVYGVISLSIPQLQLPSAKPAEDSSKTTSSRPLRTDSLIIAPPPKRKIAAAAQASVSGVSRSAYIINSHFIVEFGLLVLNHLLKHKNLCVHKDGNSSKLLSMLDPLIPVIYSSLNDTHAKLVALSLRCICTLLRAPLPSINEYASKFSIAIFTLLHKYAGSTTGDNFEMLLTAFKAISTLVRHVKSHEIDEDQLRILLTHAEQALWDPKLQSIAFGLLKTIIKKKLTLEELPQVMMRLAELSIKSEALPVRSQSRKLLLQYLIDYPLGKKVINYLEFFLAQLEYENEAGRLSAIEFLVTVFNSFPRHWLTPYCTMFFVTISPRLVNETSASCVKAVATSIQTLLENLNTPIVSNLFDIALTWMKENNTLHKRLAVQLCGIFVAAEKETFQSRIEVLLPELVKLLDVAHSELEDRDSDLLLIQTHYAIIKMTQHCPVGLRNESYIDATDNLWDKVIHNLLHPHLWIRTLSARLVGTFLGWHKVDELASYALTQSDTPPKSYLMCKNTGTRLLSLASDSVAQLQSEQLDNQLVDQVIKNLVFLGKVASRLPSSHVEASEEEEKKEKSLNLPWLTGKLRRELHAEVALNPKIPTKRLAVFKWMAAVAVDLNHLGGKDRVLPMLQFFIPPLTRETNDDGAPEDVRKLSQEVAELIKGIVGTEAYSEALVKANCNIAVRRRKRAAAKKAESVTKPDKTAQLRIKKQFAKRVAKKVKIAKLKGVRPKLKGLIKKKVTK